MHLNLDALAGLIWQSFIDHIGDLGNAIVTPLVHTLERAAQGVWDAVWHSSANIVTQLPADLTYNFGPYRAVATDPLPVALGGTTLALVLLGLRTLFGAMIGRDHVITHISGRLIPAVFACLAYSVVIAQGVGLLNGAATGLGQVVIGEVLAQPSAGEPGLAVAYGLLFLLLIFYGLRLLVRLAYSLLRFIVALIFGPVALILWAIPQTEWITWFWLRELVGWGTTPLLVTACLVIALPMASGRGGFLAAAAFGIAGFQAAHDLAGLLSWAAHRGGGASPIGYVRMAAGAVSGGGAGAAAIPASRMTTLADQYGYQ